MKSTGFDEKRAHGSLEEVWALDAIRPMRFFNPHSGDNSIGQLLMVVLSVLERSKWSKAI